MAPLRAMAAGLWMGGLLLSSCASTPSMSRIQDVSVGMTQDQVVLHLGHPSEQKGGSGAQSWSYEFREGSCRLSFRDGELSRRPACEKTHSSLVAKPLKPTTNQEHAQLARAKKRFEDEQAAQNVPPPTAK